MMKKVVFFSVVALGISAIVMADPEERLNGLEVYFTQEGDSSVTVTCEAEGWISRPTLRLYRKSSSDDVLELVSNVQIQSSRRFSGAYDVTLRKMFAPDELPSDSGTMFECALQLKRTKNVIYFPGTFVDHPRVDHFDTMVMSSVSKSSSSFLLTVSSAAFVLLLKYIPNVRGFLG